MVDQAEFLERCRLQAGEPPDQPWTEESLGVFFQRFRPMGKGLAPLFADIPGGGAVHERLLQVYAATQLNWEHDAYFVVRDPVALADEEALALAQELLGNWREIGPLAGQNLLPANPKLEVRRTAPPGWSADYYDSLDALIGDVVGDWVRARPRICPEAEWLSEAFYTVACDSWLAAYLTWPWVESAGEPFAPYLALWRAGAVVRCQSEDDLAVYQPG